MAKDKSLRGVQEAIRLFTTGKRTKKLAGVLENAEVGIPTYSVLVEHVHLQQAAAARMVGFQYNIISLQYLESLILRMHLGLNMVIHWAEVESCLE